MAEPRSVVGGGFRALYDPRVAVRGGPKGKAPAIAGEGCILALQDVCRQHGLGVLMMRQVTGARVLEMRQVTGAPKSASAHRTQLLDARDDAP
jgi:hypothetical protein